MQTALANAQTPSYDGRGARGGGGSMGFRYAGPPGTQATESSSTFLSSTQIMESLSGILGSVLSALCPAFTGSPSSSLPTTQTLPRTSPGYDFRNHWHLPLFGSGSGSG